MTTAVRYNHKDLPKTYRKLLEFFPPRPIHSEEEYDEALAVLQPLAMGEGINTPDQDDYLETLSLLVEAYEDVHYPIEKRTPLQLLKHFMEQHDMSANDLGRLLGDKPLGSRILRGERELSKAHIRKLRDHFHISADLFL